MNGRSRQLSFQGAVDRLSAGVSLLGLILVLQATLWPYKFQVAAVLSQSSLGDLTWQLLSGPSDPTDIINNLLLFTPFGYGLAGMFRHRPKALALLLVAAIGALVSLGVETGQLFLDARTATIIDVRSNMISTLIGWSIYWFAALVCRSRRNLLFMLAGYLTVALITSVAIQFSTTLRNWDRQYPLVIGNEYTGSRGWQGTISALDLADIALDPAVISQGPQATEAALASHMIVAYDLTATDIIRDRLDLGPDLAWVGTAPAPAGDDAGLHVGEGRWLSSVEAARNVSQRLAEQSQFTLRATISADRLDQGGPARIVSISISPYARNITVGQEGRDLVVRLRTPATGRDGSLPELTVPNVFTDTRAHQLLISYNGRELQVYADHQAVPQGQLLITPETMLLNTLLPPEISLSYGAIIFEPRLFEHMLPLYHALFASLLYVPLGLFLSMIGLAERRLRWWAVATSAFGITLLATLGIAALTSQMPQPITLLIGTLELAGSMIFFMRRLGPHPTSVSPATL